MTGQMIVMSVLLAWILIACWCLFASLWDLARRDLE